MTLPIAHFIQKLSRLCISEKKPVVESCWKDLPYDIMPLIFNYDTGNHLFLRMRSLCRATRARLPLEKMIYTNLFRRACNNTAKSVSHWACMIENLLKHDRRVLATYFLRRFILSSQASAQMVFMSHFEMGKYFQRQELCEFQSMLRGRHVSLTSRTSVNFSLFGQLEAITIRLDNPREDSLRELYKTLTGLHALRHLVLDSDSPVTLIPNIPQLNTLAIHLTTLTGLEFSRLISHPQLTSLTVRTRRLGEEAVPAHVVVKSSLQKLTLEVTSKTKSSTILLPSSHMLSLIGRIKSLQTLRLCLPLFTHRQVLHLLADNPRYQSLSITTHKNRLLPQSFPLLLLSTRSLHLNFDN